MRFTFRLLTILCYFLPFTFFLTTCNNGLELRFSYNQKEADSNLILEQQSATSTVDTTVSDYDTSIKIVQVDTTEQTKLNYTTQLVPDTTNKGDNFSDKLLKKIILPTDKSLSGIGSIFYYKNLTGKIAIGISLLVSLILLIVFKFIKFKTQLYMLLTAILCLLIFIIDSFISGVTLLFGTWLLLVLFALQLITAFNDRKKAYR